MSMLPDTMIEGTDDMPEAYHFIETWRCDECQARTIFKTDKTIKFRYCTYCGERLDVGTELGAKQPQQERQDNA